MRRRNLCQFHFTCSGCFGGKKHNRASFCSAIVVVHLALYFVLKCGVSCEANQPSESYTMQLDKCILIRTCLWQIEANFLRVLNCLLWLAKLLKPTKCNYCCVLAREIKSTFAYIVWFINVDLTLRDVFSCKVITIVLHKKLHITKSKMAIKWKLS